MTTIVSLQRPYGTRPIRPLGLWQHQGWQVKQYGITDGRLEVREELVDAVRRLAEAASMGNGGGAGVELQDKSRATECDDSARFVRSTGWAFDHAAGTVTSNGRRLVT